MKTIGLLFFLIILILTISNIAASVNRGNGIPDLFSYFYPERFVDTEQNEALISLQAPFSKAENAAQPVQLDPKIEYDPLGGALVISKTLSVPHMSEALVSQWVSEILPESLTFTFAGFAAHKQKLTEYMNQNALNELQTFMETSNILRLMEVKQYKLRSFTRDIPRLLTAGSVSDRYRWVYDVPITLTFLPTGKVNYKKMKKSDYRTETLTFRIQLGRIAQGGREGLIIETWDVLKRKKKEG